MAIETIMRGESAQKGAPIFQDDALEGIVLEADYDEDRPIALLAERQREFQKSVQGQYVDAEMPAS